MFFFPLRDDNPTSKTPWVNWVIIALCCFVFLVQLSQGSYNEVLIQGLGVTPAVLFGQELSPFRVSTCTILGNCPDVDVSAWRDYAFTWQYALSLDFR